MKKKCLQSYRSIRAREGHAHRHSNNNNNNNKYMKIFHKLKTIWTMTLNKVSNPWFLAMGNPMEAF